MDIPEDVLRVAFRLPPAKAQKYLEGKGYTFSWSWKDTWESAHARAFTVAKAMRRDVLESIRQVTERALRDGITFDRFQKTLEPYLKLAGWWGRTWPQNERGEYLDEKGNPWPVDENGTPLIPADARPPMLGSPHRLRTIYQQNLQTALNVGRYKAMMDVAEKRPYWQYSSVVDNRTTGLCRSLDGKVYRYDDPFWTVFYPPNHWRCRARVSSISERELKRDGLEVSRSDGAMTVTRNDAGETLAQLKLGGHSFATAAGFAYNPGRAALEPFTPRQLSDAAFGGVKMLGVAPHGLTPAGDLPAKRIEDFYLDPKDTKGWSDEDFVREFLRQFGADLGDERVITTPHGDAMIISDALFRDKETGAYKVDRGRRPYVRLLADTLKDPAEIWLTWVEVKGEKRLMERYIGVYDGDGKQKGGYVSFAQFRGGWHGATTFPMKLGELEKQRRGTLMYYKKK